MIIRHSHRHLFPFGGHYAPNHFTNPYLKSVVIEYASLVEEPIVWVIVRRFPRLSSDLPPLVERLYVRESE